MKLFISKKKLQKVLEQCAEWHDNKRYDIYPEQNREKAWFFDNGCMNIVNYISHEFGIKLKRCKHEQK